MLNRLTRYLSDREHRTARRTVRRYVRAARTVAPGLGAASTDDALVKIGAYLLTIATASDGLDDALAIATEHGADRDELARLFTVAVAHLGPLLTGNPNSSS